MDQNGRIEKNKGLRWFGRKTGMDMGQNGRIEKKRGLSGFGRKTGMDVGQNGRIGKEGKARGVWGGRQSPYL